MFGKPKKQKSDELPDCFARTYGVEILTDEKPDIQADEILKRMRKLCGNVDLVSAKENVMLFAFKDYVVKYSNGQMPAEVAIMISDKKIDMKRLEMTFYQSWGWREARKAVSQCEYSVMVTDMMASGLEYHKRLELFQKALYSILEVVPCKALNWNTSQQIINPEMYLKNRAENDNYDILFGALNVRLFNIEGAENETLMDTLGLGALGLPDLQCHFKNLDVNAVANILYTYGDYIFQNGDIINDGETIQGIKAHDKWKCFHEISLVEPKRVVLDVNPGKEFAAGNRN